MTSRITIEIDFDTAKPYILVKPDSESEDVRDKIVNVFREKLGFTSSWCRVRFQDKGTFGSAFFTIEPITPNELAEESKMMQEQVSMNNSHPPMPALSL